MTDEVATLFEAHADDYADYLRRRLVPPFDAFYGTAVAALAMAREGGGQVARVLDLGAGTGLLAGAVLAEYPRASLELVDGSPAMLERARERLGAGPAVHVADLRDPFPGEGYDAIVSALAIHHLDDDGKRDLFARAERALRPGGVFVNAEQVQGATPTLDAAARAWHREAALALGATPQEWAGAVERMRADRCATVEAQLGWLRDAGFTDVDAPFRQHCFAVFVARKPTAAESVT